MLFYLLAGSLATFLLCLLALRVSPHIGLMDHPERYGLTRAPIPYYGGLTIYAGFTLLALLLVPLSRELLGLLLGASLIVVTAFIDDRYRVPAPIRLFIQALAGFLLVIAGIHLTAVSSPLGGTLALASPLTTIDIGGLPFDLIGDTLTILWCVLLMNALNWLDGVPGQASGVATLAGLTILGLALRPHFHYFDQTSVIALSALFTGACAAFTLFNFPPPRILLGDTGSMLMGFLIAGLALFSGSKIATAALVTMVPLVDALRVTCERMLRGKSPLKGDYTHLHHRLLAYGFTKRQIVLFVYALSGLFGGAALLMPNAIAKLLSFSLLSLILIGISIYLARHGADELKKDAG